MAPTTTRFIPHRVLRGMLRLAAGWEALSARSGSAGEGVAKVQAGKGAMAQDRVACTAPRRLRGPSFGSGRRMCVHGRPRFARLSVHDGWKERLHPYIRTFVAAWPLSLMGFAGWLLNRFVALEVLRTCWAWPTPV